MRPPRHQPNNQQNLFRHRLENIINMRHELVILAHGIDWDRLDNHFGQFFSANGRPAIPTRMMVGLHILKHTFALSDEEVCARWVENPYFQYFCGEAFLKAQRIYNQKPQDKHKLLSWHAPEVECISKGKAHKPYEFGCKISVISTVNKSKGGHFVLQSAALHGNPYDGHTLKGAIDEYINDIGINPKRIYVDKGYRGHDPLLFFIYFFL